MYKDKEQQKQANKVAAQRRRDKAKGMTTDVTKGMTIEGMTTGCDAPPAIVGYVLVPGERVYCRPAVSYAGSGLCERWDTRPQPLNPDDIPASNNRGRYTRQDGTVYQFDGGGQVFGATHPYEDNKGKPHLAVYKDAEQVRSVYQSA